MKSAVAASGPRLARPWPVTARPLHAAQTAEAVLPTEGAPLHTAPVVCAIDFSRTSLAALELACAEASRTGAAVFVVYAFDAFPLPPFDVSPAWGEIAALRFELETEMEMLCARHRARGLTIAGRVVPGRPVIVVTEEVERTGATLLVVGTHGRTGIARAALGSVAERLVRSSAVSVLTVPLVADHASMEPAPVRTVLAAVKLDGDEVLVLDTARHLGPDVSVHALHVIDEPASRRGEERPTAQGIASAPRRGVETTLVCDVRRGAVAPTILTEAERVHADRIVVGTHRRGVLEHFVLGSVAEQVVRRSRVPVLTVRPTYGVEQPHG